MPLQRLEAHATTLLAEAQAVCLSAVGDDRGRGAPDNGGDVRRARTGALQAPAEASRLRRLLWRRLLGGVHLLLAEREEGTDASQKESGGRCCPGGGATGPSA